MKYPRWCDDPHTPGGAWREQYTGGSQKFRTKTRHFTDNPAGWHLVTNSFHQHARLLMEISPHAFFRTNISIRYQNMCFSDATPQLAPKNNSGQNRGIFLPITPWDGASQKNPVAHQHVRLLMEISPHASSSFFEKNISMRWRNMCFNDAVLYFGPFGGYVTEADTYFSIGSIFFRRKSMWRYLLDQANKLVKGICC